MSVIAPSLGVPGACNAEPARIALLGTGTVGSAVLERLAGWSGSSTGARLSLVYVANSRVALADDLGLSPLQAQSLQQAPASLSPVGSGVGMRGRRSDAGEPPSPFRADDPICRATAAVLPNPNARRVLPAGGPPFEHRLPMEEGQCLSRSDLASIEEVMGDSSTPRILIDATASDAVAARHAAWLAQGIHVVTACKLGQGSDLTRWRAIRAACAHGNTQYGDAATVGAGLPVLRSIRELLAGGDRILSISGVLSGSLAWLLNHYDGLRPFSGFVRQARDAGYSEPDPREDLSGEDVRRKLLILARAAGVELEADDVEVESLVPPMLAGLQAQDVDAALPTLDDLLRTRFASAYKNGEKLRFIAQLNCADPRRIHARIGMESLAGSHALAGGGGTDNRVAIWSDRYREQPLVIQGPGAGAKVTAAGLLDDVLRIARR